jgi:hypothetical protein
MSWLGTEGCVSALHLGFPSHDIGAVVLEQPAMVAAAMSVMTNLRDIDSG